MELSKESVVLGKVYWRLRSTGFGFCICICCHALVRARLVLRITTHAVRLAPLTPPGRAGGFAASEDSCEEDGLADDDVDGPVTAVTLPDPYQVVLQDVTLQGTGVNRLYALLLGTTSELMTAHYAAQELTDVVVGPWRAAAAGSGALRVRNVSYIKRLKIPLPLAPDKCSVWEEQRLLSRGPGGWVVQFVCTNDAPKGDCFEAHVQLCGVYVSSSSCRLRISMQVRGRGVWGQACVAFKPGAAPYSMLESRWTTEIWLMVVMWVGGDWVAVLLVCSVFVESLA